MTMIYNGGARTKSTPYGNGTLRREAVGNSQVILCKRLLDALIRKQVLLTLENPRDSYIWHSFGLFAIVALPQTRLALSDQCMHKLRPPDYTGVGDIRVRQRTSILGTRENWLELNTLCDRAHDHI